MNKMNSVQNMGEKEQRKCAKCETIKRKNIQVCFNEICPDSRPYKDNMKKQKQKQAKADKKNGRGLRALTSRWSDQYYYYTINIYNEHHETANPSFTQTDSERKLEILDIPNCNTCFISGQESKGVGDHLFEINGYAKFTNGKHGTSDEWNILPVVGKLNKSYKKFKFENGNSKDIGYQTLTQEEFQECSEDNKLIYTKIQEWKDYVILRKATLYWQMTEDEHNWLVQKEKDYKLIVSKDVQEIRMLNQ